MSVQLKVQNIAEKIKALNKRRNHTMVIGQTQDCEDARSPQIYLYIQCNPNQNPSRLFYIYIYKFILKFMLKCKGPRRTKATLKKLEDLHYQISRFTIKLQY